MITLHAKSTSEAEQLLSSGTASKVLLDYSVTTDDFFRIADAWCAQGAKISKKAGMFVISLKGFRIPPND
ncbi:MULTISPECIES: hypothetical protein [unclassified Symbiopectobacterium]|uniref:hypothetical protein n=2 Tax=Symbiopectobacterium TaxID=801 RepID=UPI0022262D46|nr:MULTISPECIES: hypothetical protein [unclassified Symbiopectobacterium]MCW2474416.1 hypothetical protein [Candidatus Symbiopectobacterium sp. NZEC151]MCW2485657.1 hypothetical protein [Candidatus Symbiopectobacterium sp. NZEC127]